MGAIVFIVIVASLVVAVPVAAILTGGGRPRWSSLTFLLVAGLTLGGVGIALLVLYAVAAAGD
jgi:hypothetical protein